MPLLENKFFDVLAKDMWNPYALIALVETYNATKIIDSELKIILESKEFGDMSLDEISLFLSEQKTKSDDFMTSKIQKLTIKDFT